MKQGWEMKRLDNVCTFINGKAYNKEELLNTGKYPVLRVGNFFTNNDWYYSDLELSEDKYCDNGDLLYAWSASFGPRIWSGEKVIYHYHIWKVIPDSKIITKEFLYHLLYWDVEKIKSDHGTGTTMMHVGKGSMDARVVPIPPILEQQRIVSILENAFAAIATAKANAEQNLKNAKELFESYLQGVFEKKGEDWEEKTLGEVIRKSETVDPTKKPDDAFIYLDVSSVNKETKEIENATVLLGKDAPSRARKLVKANDVIFATVRPTHSRVALITEEYDNQVCSTGYFVLRAKEFLNNNLVFYFLLTYGFNKQMEKLQKGASYPAVTDSEVKGIYIPYPKSMKEQQTIVQKLDALSAETKKLEAIYKQKVVALEELKKSVLQKAFNGELS